MVTTGDLVEARDRGKEKQCLDGGTISWGHRGCTEDGACQVMAAEVAPKIRERFKRLRRSSTAACPKRAASDEQHGQDGVWRVGVVVSRLMDRERGSEEAAIGQEGFPSESEHVLAQSERRGGP